MMINAGDKIPNYFSNIGSKKKKCALSRKKRFVLRSLTQKQRFCYSEGLSERGRNHGWFHFILYSCYRVCDVYVLLRFGGIVDFTVTQHCQDTNKERSMLRRMLNAMDRAQASLIGAQVSLALFLYPLRHYAFTTPIIVLGHFSTISS